MIQPVQARSVAVLAFFSSLLFMPAVSGCVARELRTVNAARDAYDDCVLEFSDAKPECEALHVSYLEAQSEFDEHARRAWGCNSSEEVCPTPR